MYKSVSNYQSGFTLAETLITLMIIGVIAAMTIPSIAQDTKQKELKAAWRKAYSTASQAWMLAYSDNPAKYTGRGGWNCTWPQGDSGDTDANDDRVKVFKKEMRVIKTCEDKEGCWPTSYENHSILGSYAQIKKNSWISSDGMCWGQPFSDTAHIAVDTNCQKAPNKIGQDIFSLFLGADGSIYFAIDDKSVDGQPVSSGKVCPFAEAPVNINGRQVDFSDWIVN